MIGSSPAASEPVLVTDLDGTLIATDLLYESFVSALKSAPWVVAFCPFWLARGKARLKEELASRANLETASLPYRQDVLAFLRKERARGRRIVLATASWHDLAQSVSRHLGVFDDVFATTREGNLKGEAKSRRLVERFGEGGFDYIGNSDADLAVWQSSRIAYVVGGIERFQESLPEKVLAKEVPDSAIPVSAIRGAIRSLRMHQWAKNLLVFVPLIAAHKVGDPLSLVLAAQAFASLCLIASSAYLLNDLFDLPSDRLHPRKRYRPLASGQLSIPAGFALCAGTLALGMALAWWLPPKCQATLVAYLGLTLAYSLGLKRAPILDVITLAALYTIRIIAGGFAIGAPVSFWLLAFAMFLFFSLALVKRYAEIASLGKDGIDVAPGRGYGAGDAAIILAIGAASAMVSALVLALYINGETVKILYARPAMLWLLCPALVFWVSRLWLLAARGQMHDDPVLFAVRDRASYVVAAAGAIAVWLAT